MRERGSSHSEASNSDAKGEVQGGKESVSPSAVTQVWFEDSCIQGEFTTPNSRR